MSKMTSCVQITFPILFQYCSIVAKSTQNCYLPHFIVERPSSHPPGIPHFKASLIHFTFLKAQTSQTSLNGKWDSETAVYQTKDATLSFQVEQTTNKTTHRITFHNEY